MDNTLGLLFEIAADPSKAVAATELFRDKTIASTDAIKGALENARIALEQGFGEFSARTQLEAAGLTEAAAKAAVAGIQTKQSVAASTADVQEWAAALGSANKGLSQAELATIDFGRALAGQDGLSASVTNARIAAQGLAQDLGVHLPRAATSFLASLPEFAPLLSVAFAPIAIFGLIEALGQVPKMFEKIEGAITGWSETAQREYQKELELNDRYAEHVGKTYEAVIALAEARQKSAAATHEEANQTEVLYATSGLLGLAMEKLGIGPLHALLDAANKAQDKANELALKAEELQAQSFFNYAKKVSQGTLAGDHEKILKLQEEEQKKAEAAAKKQEHLREEADDKYANFWAARVKLIEHEKKVEEDATKTYAEANLARIKYDEEMTKRIVSGIKERLNQEEAADRQIKQITDENVRMAKHAAEEVIRAAEQRNEAQSHAADTALKLEERNAKTLLRLHKISSAEFLSDEQQALDRWYNLRKAAIDKQLAMSKSVWGEESAEYQRLIRQMEALDDEYASHKEQTANQAETADHKQRDSVINSLSAMAGALKSHHALEVGLIVAKAAIKIAEETAAALSAFAYGDYRAGALHLLSAAEYGVVAGSRATSGGSSGGGGGGGGYGGGGGQSGSYGGGGGAALAAGAVNSPSGPSLHVIILGPSDAANYLAGTLNNGVRNGQVQVMATHGPSGQGL